MPNLANLNLGSFMPEFTRSLGQIKAKQPMHASSVQKGVDMMNGESSIVPKDVFNWRIPLKILPST